ncbi:hypothetical protein PGB90_002823 [Kerria lacca]
MPSFWPFQGWRFRLNCCTCRDFFYPLESFAEGDGSGDFENTCLTVYGTICLTR